MHVCIEKDRLSSIDVSNLWSSYILETMVHHSFNYYLNNVEDTVIKEFLEFCQQVSRSIIDDIISVLKTSNISPPRGITSEDVNINAPRGITDVYYITIINGLAKFALINYSTALAESSNKDIRNLFSNCINKIIEVDEKVKKIMLSKGVYPTHPEYIPSRDVEFIDSKDFFKGFLGDRRALTVSEAKSLFQNTHENQVGKAQMLAFIKVAKSKEIREFFEKGRELSDKYVKLFSEKLLDEGITPPPSLDSEIIVGKGMESPYSDRFMLMRVALLTQNGIGSYAMSLAQSQRNDLTAMYAKIMVEVGMLANEGVNLLIKNHWLEQPPLMDKTE